MITFVYSLFNPDIKWGWLKHEDTFCYVFVQKMWYHFVLKIEHEMITKRKLIIQCEK